MDVSALNEEPKAIVNDTGTGGAYHLHYHTDLTPQQAMAIARTFRALHPRQRPKRGKATAILVTQDMLNLLG